MSIVNDPRELCAAVAERIVELGHPARLEGGGTAGPWVWTRLRDVSVLWGPDAGVWYGSATELGTGEPVEDQTVVDACVVEVEDGRWPEHIAAAIVAAFPAINAATAALREPN